MTNMNSIDEKEYMKKLKQGVKHLEEVRMEEAIQIFDELLEVNPDDYNLWFYKGIAHSANKKDKSVECFEKFVNLHPDNHSGITTGLSNLEFKELLLTMGRVRLNTDESKRFFHELNAIGEMNENLSESSLNRKSRSEEILKRENVPFLEGLPAIVDETQARKRSKEEIGYRALCLIIITLKAQKFKNKVLFPLISRWELLDHFTYEELLFIKKKKPKNDSLNTFSWRVESAWVLLWSLGHVKTLGRPEKMNDLDPVNPFLNDNSLEEFLANIRLKPISEILDIVDLIYRYDWAVVDARTKNEPAPGNIDPDVLYEWHYACNWLIGHKNQDWDDITCDT